MGQAVKGVFKSERNGGGTLRAAERSFQAAPGDPIVPAELARSCGLVEGATVAGEAEAGKRGLTLARIDSVCGLSPADFGRRRSFRDLVAIDPQEKFDLAGGGETAMRIVDLVAPLGKGTRALVVAPPKAGKTTLLEQIAAAIRRSEPAARIIVLLVDERPEEVTHFRRTVDAEVLASSSDASISAHTELVELTLAHVRCELECGNDVVLLVDSLTRMGRAFNLKGTGRRGQTMSGGLEAGSMEIPRRFFGLARKIENGGSVTIVATALVDTGSRMDQVIFEEFKGTGNAEIVLNRELAELRLFPAIDLPASGTRKEHKLYTEDDLKRLNKVRRALLERQPAEALKSVLNLMAKYPTNADFLKTIPLG